jgi:uncharacterized repeat protein (TIGR01451 family)
VTWGFLPATGLSAGADSAAANVSVTDTTTVVSGQVKLVKTVLLDVNCANAATYAVLNGLTGSYLLNGGSATSQNCLEYQIQVTNTGTTTVSGVTVADTAPPYTTIQGTAVASPLGTCGTTLAPAVTGTSPFTVGFTGNVAPNCSLYVYFKVKLN